MDYSKVKQADAELYQAMMDELERQRTHIELIASENFVTEAVLTAMGSHLTNKYAEGYPGHRYYGGCEFVDVAEDLARDRAKALFGAEHVNVQPHSGAQANTAVYFAMLKPGDTIMGMNLSHGGHLTHGMKINYSGKYFNIVPYGVTEDTQTIDYDELERLAVENKPQMIVAGASAYPRTIDFKRFGEIAKKVGAYLMVDIAHIAGLIVAGEHPSPVPHADFVTTTTHKTLRGPRGGMIMCKEEYAKAIDKAIFPGTQGGPLMHVIAAKAVAFKEALGDDFKAYQKRIVKNATALAEGLLAEGLKLVSGGTDNHLMLVDLTDNDVTGKEVEAWMDEANITCNKNTIPFETKSAMVTSGVRLGTPAVTTRGMNEVDMKKIASFIARIVKSKGEANAEVKKEVLELCANYPLYQ